MTTQDTDAGLETRIREADYLGWLLSMVVGSIIIGVAVMLVVNLVVDLPQKRAPVTGKTAFTPSLAIAKDDVSWHTVTMNTTNDRRTHFVLVDIQQANGIMVDGISLLAGYHCAIYTSDGCMHNFMGKAFYERPMLNERVLITAQLPNNYGTCSIQIKAL